MSCAHRCDPAAALQILKLLPVGVDSRTIKQRIIGWLSCALAGPSPLSCAARLLCGARSYSESWGLFFNLAVGSFSHRVCSFLYPLKVLSLCSDLAAGVVVAALLKPSRSIGRMPTSLQNGVACSTVNESSIVCEA